jgi:hypothetical protein
MFAVPGARVYYLPAHDRKNVRNVEGCANLNGADTNEVVTVREAWKGIPVQNFSNSSELEAWEKNWPNGDGRPAAKVIYDPAAGEVWAVSLL